MRCYNCENGRLEDRNFSCISMPQCLMKDVERRELYEELDIKVGDKIQFAGEKRFWKVVARDERYMICTWGKYYTICDLVECIRGADNYDGYYTYTDNDPVSLAEALYRLHLDESVDFREAVNLPKIVYDSYAEDLKMCETVGFEPDPMIDTLGISYRNFVPLDITKKK